MDKYMEVNNAASELVKLIQLDVGTDKLEALAEQLEDSVTELEESVTVVIDGIEIYVPSSHHDITVEELVGIADERKKENILTGYLKKKYNGYIGLPAVMLQEELLATDDEMVSVGRWLKAEFGNKKLEFIPFNFVAQMIVETRD